MIGIGPDPIRPDITMATTLPRDVLDVMAAMLRRHAGPVEVPEPPDMAPDSDPFVDDDPTPPSGYTMDLPPPPDFIPLPPCDICGEDACDHERVAPGRE